jgi:hypothetical protein
MGLLWFLKKKKIKNASHDSNSLKKRSDIDESNEIESDDFLNIKSKKKESEKFENPELEDTRTNKKQRFTPNRINKLAFNEVFVFGSNLKGHHNGGAAKIALEKFGAKYGQGIGKQGQSYAIPTMQGGVETIILYVNDFIEYAKKHTDRYFLVTRIGCGIAGFSDEQIAPLFERAISLSNVILPKSFFYIIKKNQILRINKIKEYGQARAIADIIKSLNNINKYDKLQTLLNDLNSVVNDYIKRETITGESFALIKSILYKNEYNLFPNNRFNFDLFTKLIIDKEYINEEIENIFKLQSNIKLFNILKFLNTKRNYSSSYDVINDLSILSESYLFNQYNPEPLYFLSQGLRNSWNEITLNGKLDNDLLEKVIFKDHKYKIEKLGLEKVIEIDFTQGGCHTNVYSPKKIGTAPIYVKLNNNEYVKSCGQGVGPYGSPNDFEEQILSLLNGC